MAKEQEALENICPEYKANIISKITYSWLTDLIKLGAKKPLDMKDLYTVGPNYQSSYLHTLFKKNWQEQVDKHAEKKSFENNNSSDNLLSQQINNEKTKKPSLFRAMFDSFGRVYFPAGLLKLVSDACNIVSPMLLKWLMETLSHGNYEPWFPYMICGVIFLVQMVATVSLNTYFQIVMLTGLSVRTSLTALIFDKSLNLSNRGRQQFSTGQIVNMMSTDSSRIDMLAGYAHYLWSGPVTIIAIVVLLWNIMGVSSLAGFGLLVILLPVNAVLMNLLAKMRKKNSTVTDQRVRFTQEVLNGIRVIKFYAWEESFLNRLLGLRDQELGYVKKLVYARAAVNAMVMILPVFSSIISFAVYGALGNELKAEIVFPAFTFFNILRFPMILLPMVIAQLTDTKVAVSRIQDYLIGEEIESKPKIEAKADFGVKATGCEFVWDDLKSSKSPPEDEDESVSEKDVPRTMTGTLSNITLEIPKGSLVAIVGNVGSGKSSLLRGLLGEMKQRKGEVLFGGSIGYCSQQAWIQNDSVQGNITFGKEMNPDWYNKAIHYSALEKDLSILPNGDETEIGEKGINLSGGQKQRVSLARAIYFDADIIMLDDPLSAVDAHVGRFIFEQCILSHWKDKTRLLVTHQLHFASRCDYIIFMDGGRIIEQGTFRDLIHLKGEFSTLMAEFGGGSNDEEKEEETEVAAKEIVKEKQKEETASKGLMTIEERAIGSVPLKTYMRYFDNCGGWIFVFFVVFLALFSQATRVANDIWLAIWSDDYLKFTTNQYMSIYVGMGFGQLVITVVFGLLFALGGIRASRKLFKAAIMRVMHCPSSFFDTTPLGRIINRFSKDQDSLDGSLPDAFRAFINTATTILATYAFVVAKMPFFGIPLVVLLIVYYFAQKVYRSVSRELKRIDALSRSPLFAHFQETLTGISTIRAYSEEARFMKRNQFLIDTNNRPLFLQISIQRWLSIRLETIGSLLIACACVLCIVTQQSVALVGLILSYSLAITGTLNWAVRQAAETETQMNAVERIEYYANDLDQEAPFSIEETAPPSEWPSAGEIDIENLTIKYRPELDPVLFNLSIHINCHEKIGIVGRTGAGKSSITMALFRLVEKTEGTIKIDGVDISRIGLKDLRTKLAIIPQDPVLFSGTIRSNLDPFGQYNDDDLWEVLQHSSLKHYVSSLADKLEAPVEDNGSNFSVGQRQLLCLARAMLRKAKILIMDEATASIDVQTDSLIQDVIRKYFQNSTVLTIAHRLNTVIDYDRIIVLDHGRILEYENPHILLSKGDSMLSSMVDETGASNAELLRQQARESYEKVNNRK